ncbi:hypothetical protein GOP47_0004662 [Adiantum capillus-veneris]|uniref:Uncharacterized protein n=1 Tax=Adiantum capillus-veneris TaxID=13818 RepID=A0A9D4V7Z3_ADICA|nr:hypothetical protein GOP47_0004662 [Adiantum capillus-veneris]
MLPYLSNTHEGFLVEASPSIIFMLANVIVLAILLTSNRSAKPAVGKRPSSPLTRPSQSKLPKLHLAKLHHQEQLASAAKPNIYGSQQALANPNETLTPLALQSNELLSTQKQNEGSFPEVAAPWKSSGEGGMPLAEALPNSDKALILDVAHEEGNNKKAIREAAQNLPSNDDLDKRFDEFISTFFARVRAEIRESSV